MAGLSIVMLSFFGNWECAIVRMHFSCPFFPSLLCKSGVFNGAPLLNGIFVTYNTCFPRRLQCDGKMSKVSGNATCSCTYPPCSSCKTRNESSAILNTQQCSPLPPPISSSCPSSPAPSIALSRDCSPRRHQYRGRSDQRHRCTSPQRGLRCSL